jgi:hypothetical protein
MQAVVDVTVMAAAVVWSAVIIIALLKCNLHRTPLCSVAGLGVTAMVWRAFPPVQELPLVVSFIFWLGCRCLCITGPPSYYRIPRGSTNGRLRMTY